MVCTTMRLHATLRQNTPLFFDAIYCCRLEHVLSNYIVDFSKRMEDMMGSLQEASAETADQENIQHAILLLEELHEIVESIDFARDLKSIGGLPVVKQLLVRGAPELRWRAADVLAACAQNNLPVQVRHPSLKYCTPAKLHKTCRAPVI